MSQNSLNLLAKDLFLILEQIEKNFSGLLCLDLLSPFSFQGVFSAEKEQREKRSGE